MTEGDSTFDHVVGTIQSWLSGAPTEEFSAVEEEAAAASDGDLDDGFCLICLLRSLVPADTIYYERTEQPVVEEREEPRVVLIESHSEAEVRRAEEERVAGSVPIYPAGSPDVLTPGGGFYDPGYAADPDPQLAQHLGVDIAVANGTIVRAPVSGRIIGISRNGTNTVVRLRASHSNQTHVLGHVSPNANLTINTDVAQGDEIATVNSTTSAQHLHWGVNQNREIPEPTNEWGWGRAPLNATLQEVTQNGWLDPLSLMR